jgi:hypothetical protein
MCRKQIERLVDQMAVEAHKPFGIIGERGSGGARWKHGGDFRL